MSEMLERVLAEKKVDPAAAAEIRAFERFLGRLPNLPHLPGPAVVAALDHWDQSYVAGGPHPPHRWEGDDS